ncbi:MAG: hypothetical protein K2R98_31420 [Gemmataceae bacterium]|nr:hypothetical protein [Gemmataceae bacterium]
MHPRRYVSFIALTLALWFSSRTPAADDARPIIAGFERFHTGDKADPVKGGSLLLGELNCTSCHQAEDNVAQRKQAPILDHVGSRARIGYLKKFLSDPQATKPGTTMPHLFADDGDKDAKVEALVHFLASTGPLKQERPDAKAVPLGRDAYAKIGCVACHGPRDAAGQAEKAAAVTVPLGDLKAKYSISGLTGLLENPTALRPSGRMPHLANAKAAKEIANYLLQGIKVEMPAGKGSTTFAYYEGDFSKVPDFDKIKPVATGTGGAFNLGDAKRGNSYAMKFDGFFKVEREGKYRFNLNSDDGSKLLVDGKVVVDNDGVHPPKAVAGTVELTKGVHKVSVQFFQAGGGAELSVQVDGPGVGSQDFAGLVAATEAALDKIEQPKRVVTEDDLEIKPELVDRGKELFASAGCASCHPMNVDKKPLVSTLMAPALAKLKGQNGCVAEAPAKGKPWFALSPAQRTALTAAIQKPTPLSKEPKEVIARTFTTFNCYACHSRDKVGGSQEALDKFFQTTQPEMGDEGRVPPPLDGVGAKLTTAYLKQLLDKGAADRPYMHTHMPGFGLANVGALVEAFEALDKLPAIPEVKFEEPMPRIKTAGRHMVGGQALGCIKCHTFNGVKAEGIQGIDMTVMTTRLKRDWFHAYLIDPQKIRPGTRMPTAWPDGESVLPKVLDGKTATQVEAIWAFLGEGKAARVPFGMGKQAIPLEPEGTAIIYRNFIQGAGTRGIAVGYPEKAHLAFDANDIRLAMIWQGAFIDAGKHWTDRGTGFEGPLGDNILNLPTGASFAILGKPDAAWPTGPVKELGWKFNGYRLTPDERPTFLYSLGDVKVEDFPNAVAGKDPSLKRSLKLSAAKATEDLYFRAAVGTKIEAIGQGWYRIDGWKMKIDSAEAPKIRQSAGKTELLVPVKFTDGKAQIAQEFVW